MSREMKESGIEWVGQIPTTWKSIPLKYIVEYNKEDLREGTDPEFQFEYIDIGSVTYGKGISGTEIMKFKNSPSRARRKVGTGDVILSTVRTYLKAVAKIEQTSIPQIASTGFIVLTPKKDIRPTFLFYAILANSFICKVEAHSTGISYPAINAAQIVSFKIPVPDIEEQIKIADFLDNQCTEIDSILTRTRDSIDEYKKMKRAVISQTVTKGIRKNRKMKPCDNRWVMELPEEWAEIPSKFLFRNSDTRRLDSDEQLTASQKYGIISQQEYMARENARVVLADKGLENWKHVEPYDFIISLRSFQGGLEMSEVTGCITWHYIVLKPCKKIYSKYFKWLFKSELYIKALQRTCNFIRDGQDLRYSNFVQVPLFEPPIEEQREIADYLDKTCSEIDTLIAKKEQYLVELENYKKSLIYEYVTGKKEVPNG